MKVFFVVPDFQTIGAQRIAIDYGNKLLADGVDVFWISGGSGPLANEINSNRVLSYRPLLKVPRVRVIESLIRLFGIVRKIEDATVVSIPPPPELAAELISKIVLV